MESQAADGSNSLSHKTIVVFDIVDQLTISIVDCSELIHWATGKEWREHGVIDNVVGTPILLPTAPFSAGETSAHQAGVQGALTSSEIDFSCTMATSAQRDLQKGSNHSPCYSVWQRENMESWCRRSLEADPLQPPGLLAADRVLVPCSVPKHTHAEFIQGHDMGVRDSTPSLLAVGCPKARQG